MLYLEEGTEEEAEGKLFITGEGALPNWDLIENGDGLWGTELGEGNGEGRCKGLE